MLTGAPINGNAYFEDFAIVVAVFPDTSGLYCSKEHWCQQLAVRVCKNFRILADYYGNFTHLGSSVVSVQSQYIFRILQQSATFDNLLAW